MNKEMRWGGSNAQNEAYGKLVFMLFFALCSLHVASPVNAQIQIEVNGKTQAQTKMPAVGDTVRGVYVGEWLQNAPPDSAAFAGKPVLLEFWATWCRPCLAAVPHLNELHDEFGDAFRFIAITQEPRAVAAPILKNVQMKSAVVSDTKQGTTHKVFGVWVIPRTYILSADRVVLWTGHPTRLTREILQKLLDSLE
ncbi:MAG: hypothetical protein C0600_01300 [Ignavibacteria bacterium]|nr:MAG: hypothetical protein C0600_01300 [Ignavibacteria bacterium]